METADSPTYTPLLDARTIEPVKIDMASLGHYIPEWAGREKIGVNMDVLAEVAQVMRMRSLTVLGMNEKGEEEIVVQGVFKDGSATGAASGTVTFKNKVLDSGARPFWEDLENLDMDCGREKDFRDFVIRLNLAALEHRIATSASTVRDPKLWVDFINQELSRELKRLAWKRFKPDAHKVTLEAIYPFAVFYGLIMIPVREALKGDWDPKALLGALGTAGICAYVAQIINNPTTLMIILYLAFMVGAKQSEWMGKDAKSLENYLENHAGHDTDPYDPVTPFTFANFEWDRLLEVHQLLSRYKLVTLLEEIESQAAER